MATSIKRSTRVYPKALSLGEAKLKSSGLTLEDGKKLGMTVLSEEATAALHSAFKPLCSLKLDYFDHFGTPLPDWPMAKPFYRLRYLEKDLTFSGLASKESRYVQEPNSAPVAYFPLNQKWVDLVANPDEPLIIAEGELKAAKACKEGFPTIGLGGVHNWRSSRLGLVWLPSLECVKWVKRNVYLVFDSDYRTNPSVLAALRDFAEELHERGAFVHLVSLPVIDGLEKVGLDDFLIHAPSANQQFRELLKQAEPLGLTRPLFGLNERYVYVKDPGMIIDQDSLFKASPSAFRDHLEAGKRYQEKTIKNDGGISYKAVAASAAWLTWPMRREVQKLTFKPGAEKFVNKPYPMFNIWPGWGVEPQAGDIEPFLQLIDHVFTGAEPAAKQWFIRWCAYPLQNPGVKMYSAVLVHGIKHGTGKSLIGYTLGKIYGKTFTEISQKNLHGDFNEWAEGKQLVMGDDITGSNKRQDNDYLKKLITQNELRVNTKFVPSYVVPDCINYYFTANQPDVFFLEDDDRRNFIHEVIVGPLPEDFYTEYALWLEAGGAAAVFDYMKTLDLGDYNPAGRAFSTSAKSRMIANGQSDMAGWVRGLIDNPAFALRFGDVAIDKDLFSSKDLLNLYDPTGRTGTTANGLGRELARAGIRQVCNGMPVRVSDGSQTRYFAVRNTDVWEKASSSDVAKHLDGWSKKQGAVKQAKY